MHTRGRFSPFICDSSMYQYIPPWNREVLRTCFFCATLKVFNDIPMVCVIAMVFFQTYYPYLKSVNFSAIMEDKTAFFHSCLHAVWRKISASAKMIYLVFIYFFPVPFAAMSPYQHLMSSMSYAAAAGMSFPNGAPLVSNKTLKNCFWFQPCDRGFLARLQLCIMLWI